MTPMMSLCALLMKKLLKDLSNFSKWQLLLHFSWLTAKILKSKLFGL